MDHCLLLQNAGKLDESQIQFYKELYGAKLAERVIRGKKLWLSHKNRREGKVETQDRGGEWSLVPFRKPLPMPGGLCHQGY